MLLRNNAAEDERSERETLVKSFTILSWLEFLPESSFELLQPSCYKLFEELVSYFAFWHLLQKRGQIIYLGVEFTHQQTRFLLKKNIKIYIKIHINIAPTCLVLRPSSGNLH